MESEGGGAIGGGDVAGCGGSGDGLARDADFGGGGYDVDDAAGEGGDG